MEERNKKMVIFGTLFESKVGGIKDLLVLLGKENEVKEIDAEFQRRKILGPWGLKKIAKLYKGLSEDELKRRSLDYCQKNLLKGLREAATELKIRKFIIGALSSNPQFTMDILKEILTLDFAIGTQLEFKKGVATGRIQKEVNRYTKAKILKAKKKKYGVNKKNVIFIARSSITHLPMAREAGIFIGFDPEKESIDDIAHLITTNLEKIVNDKSYGY